jgi:hypothetical protein
MRQGRLQADGTICRTGPACKRHGGKTVNVADSIKRQLVSAKTASYASSTAVPISTPTAKPAVTPVEAPIKNDAVRAAVTSSLNYTGPKPQWWNKYRENALADKAFPTDPKLLDIIDSPIGKLAVIWQDTSQDERQKTLINSKGMGLYSCYYNSVETGERVGYVNMAYMDKDTLKRSFGDDEFAAFRYQEEWSGSSYDLTDWDADDDDDNYVPAYSGLTGEALLEKRREVWLGAMKADHNSVTTTDGKYVEYYNLDKEHVPDDETVKKDLDKYSKAIHKNLKKNSSYFTTPYVDYSKVDSKLAGKGLGSALYIYTARALAQKGKVLRGSGIQSNEAQALWGRFKHTLPLNTRKMELIMNGEKKKYFALDFR